MTDSFVLKNVSEDLIDMYIDECMQHTTMCTCSRCRADVSAFALNLIAPHYVVSESGDMMVRARTLSNQFQADVITAITQAVLIVGKNPRHDAEGHIPKNRE
jgi:competence protein ComFB